MPTPAPARLLPPRDRIRKWHTQDIHLTTTKWPNENLLVHRYLHTIHETSTIHPRVLSNSIKIPSVHRPHPNPEPTQILPLSGFACNDAIAKDNHRNGVMGTATSERMHQLVRRPTATSHKIWCRLYPLPSRLSIAPREDHGVMIRLQGRVDSTHFTTPLIRENTTSNLSRRNIKTSGLPGPLRAKHRIIHRHRCRTLVLTLASRTAHRH